MVLLASQTWNVCGEPIQTASNGDAWADVTAEWDRFRSAFIITRAEFVCEDRSSPKQKESRQSKITVKSYGEKYVLITETFRDGSWKGEVFARNDLYGFQLTRASSERPWVLTHLATKQRMNDLDIVQHRISTMENVLNLYPLDVNGVLLNELCRHPVFEVTDLKETNSTAPLLDVAFKIKDPTVAMNNGTRVKFQTGRLTLNRDKSCLPLECELEFPSGEVFKFEYSDFQTQQSLWYPTKTSGICRNKDGTQWDLGTMTVRELRLGGAVPDRDFTLSHFGLPEPFETARRFPTYIWIGAAAIVMIAFGMYLRARARVRNA